MRKRLITARAYPDVNEKKKTLARELSVIERKSVSLPELDRRIMNIPSLQKVLKDDSEVKRWRKIR